MRAALLMPGNEADPVFCYANRTAQRLWGLTWDEFIRLPSRHSAEPLVQAERDRLLAIPPHFTRREFLSIAKAETVR